MIMLEKKRQLFPKLKKGKAERKVRILVIVYW